MKTKINVYYAVMLLLIFCCLHGIAGAQVTNLQYSRVILVGSAEETVPSGKVWKIENILPSAKLTSISATGNGNDIVSSVHQIVVNGSNVFVASSDAIKAYSASAAYAAYTSSASNILNNAMWLPADTRLKAGTNVLYISVIEFTEN